jgi:hypothetical protein
MGHMDQIPTPAADPFYRSVKVKSCSRQNCIVVSIRRRPLFSAPFRGGGEVEAGNLASTYGLLPSLPASCATEGIKLEREAERAAIEDNLRSRCSVPSLVSGSSRNAGDPTVLPCASSPFPSFLLLLLQGRPATARAPVTRRRGAGTQWPAVRLHVASPHRCLQHSVPATGRCLCRFSVADGTVEARMQISAAGEISVYLPFSSLYRCAVRPALLPDLLNGDHDHMVCRFFLYELQSADIYIYLISATYSGRSSSTISDYLYS